MIYHFIPEVQFGFIKRCGTADYGSVLSLTLHRCLEDRGEGILISLDVYGVFDRTWWAHVKARLKAKGMKKRALKLVKSYLCSRWLYVVINGNPSSNRQLWSSVPQGGKWSPKLWDFDISEMHCALIGQGSSIFFCRKD